MMKAMSSKEQSDQVSSEVFRHAMSLLSAPVVLVTTDGPSGRHGLTVSAICSVSLSPPTLLFCINRDNRSHEAFLENRKVGISILKPGHEALAFRFASGSLTQEEKFKDNEWIVDQEASPVLADASVTLTGRIMEILPSGSHDIIISQIQDIVFHEEHHQALVWFGKGFHHICS